MSVTAAIEKQMANLCTMFCMPRITLNTETGKVDITYIWTNDEARKFFEYLQDELTRHYVELRKREAVEQSVQSDGAKSWHCSLCGNHNLVGLDKCIGCGSPRG